MGGVAIASNEIPPALKLYLNISPYMNLEYRCLPREGGWLDQDYEFVQWVYIIEERIRDILARKQQEFENKSRKK